MNEMKCSIELIALRALNFPTSHYAKIPRNDSSLKSLHILQWLGKLEDALLCLGERWGQRKCIQALWSRRCTPQTVQYKTSC